MTSCWWTALSYRRRSRSDRPLLLVGLAATDESAATFNNVGKDALLVVPCPRASL
jgi:hypothetical protein